MPFWSQVCGAEMHETSSLAFSVILEFLAVHFTFSYGILSVECWWCLSATWFPLKDLPHCSELNPVVCELYACMINKLYIKFVKVVFGSHHSSQAHGRSLVIDVVYLQILLHLSRSFKPFSLSWQVWKDIEIKFFDHFIILIPGRTELHLGITQKNLSTHVVLLHLTSFTPQGLLVVLFCSCLKCDKNRNSGNGFCFK